MAVPERDIGHFSTDLKPEKVRPGSG